MIQQKPPKDLEKQKTDESAGTLLPDPFPRGPEHHRHRACFLRASQALREGSRCAHFTDEETEVLGATGNHTGNQWDWACPVSEPCPIPPGAPELHDWPTRSAFLRLAPISFQSEVTSPAASPLLTMLLTDSSRLSTK